MQLRRYFWDAAVALDPAAREIDDGVRFGLSKTRPVRALFRGAGLSDVEVRTIDVPTPFADFDDYWTPFLGGPGSRAQLCHVARRPNAGALSGNGSARSFRPRTTGLSR